MGYYSTVETRNGLSIKPELIGKVKQDVQFCKDHEPSYLYSSVDGEHKEFAVLRNRIGISGDYVFWHIASIEIEDNGYFYWEGEQKFYGYEDLAEYLKDKVTTGDLVLVGEDGEGWGFRFDGQGNYKRLMMDWTEAN